MADDHRFVVDTVIVEEDVEFSLDELCRACHADRERLVRLIDEGVLTPAGSGPQDWRFAGTSLRRARLALRLARDLHLGEAGTALVLDLLDRIDALESRLRRAGLR